MAKLDGLKEELGILKFWLGIVVATLLALTGWTITNYQKIELLIIAGAIICIITALFLVYVLNKKIKTKIKEIEKA